MIRITRGDEPADLVNVRARELVALRILGRAPVADEIRGYRIVSRALWLAQFSKCCYCEHKTSEKFNDVEHYRPKVRADRRPGCTKTHGYWWLAFSWDNLLFACPSCNRTGKNDLFPLGEGCSSLEPEQPPPGGEVPLLIDPASATNPVEHIMFSLETIAASATAVWWARPRAGSVMGQMSITACDLNRVDLLELRNDYVRNFVSPQVAEVRRTFQEGDRKDLERGMARALALLAAPMPYVALAYDALRHFIPDDELIQNGLEPWPEPRRVAE